MPVTRIIMVVVAAGAAAAYLVGNEPAANHVLPQQQAGLVLPGFDMGRRDPAATASIPARRTLLAQADTPTADPQPAASAPEGGAPQPDLTALRYFAREGNQRRVDAEIARLRLLYPGWAPPDNLAEPEQQGDAELDRMWQLFAAGKFGEARSAIATRRAADATWVPPEDLLVRLNEAEARERLVNASDAKQWEKVLQVAAEAPGLLTCADPDSLWRVGEAFARTDRADRARDAYQYLLKNCDDASVRLATVQKAVPLLDPTRVDQLLALERKGPDGRGEFEAVRADVLRAKIGRAAETSAAASDADLTALEGIARSGTSPDDPLVLGWYYLRQNAPLKALDWFKLSSSRQDTPKAAEGLVLTLSALGRNQEAEPIAYTARDKSADNLIAYRIVATALLAADPPPRLEANVVARAAEELGKAREASGAQALGWYAYNTNQIATAIQWFSTALRWDAQDEPSAYGLALSYQNRKDRARFNQIVAEWGDRSDRIAALGDPRRRRTGAAPARQSATTQPAVTQAQAALSAPAPSPTVSVVDIGTGGLEGSISRASEAYRAQRAAEVARPYAGQPREDVRPTPTGRETAAVAVRRSDPVEDTPRDIQPASYEAPEPRRARSTGRAILDDFSEPVAQVQLAQASPLITKGDAPLVTKGTGGVGRGIAGCPLARSPDTAVARGWCLMELERPMEAMQAFDMGLQGSGQVQQDAAYGKAQAGLRAGLTSEAAAAAMQAPQSPRRMADLTNQILLQRALAAYRDEKYAEAIVLLEERARYVPEQTDLLMLRGWAYFNMRRYSDAERVFQAVSRTGNAAGIRGLTAIGEVTGRIKD
jgi:cellulose synthase operon protein C